MIVGGLLMLLFWGGVIALAFFAIRWLMQSGRSDRADQERSLPPRDRDAFEVLKERYARGEITREQYLEMKHDLET
jgi:putative membrane protein